MSILFIFLCLIHCKNTLQCYDCTNCPYPWSNFGTQTYESLIDIFSRVQSCYKKEFYNGIDRRVALDRDCRARKLETIDERSMTYCCYSNYCNSTLLRKIGNCAIVNIIIIFIFVMFVVREEII